MQPRHYAEALIAVLNAGHDPKQTLARLDEVLARRGHMKLKPAILRHTYIRLQERTAAARLSVAVKEDAVKYTKEAESFLRDRDIAGSPEVVVDETLIGGFKLEGGNTSLDRSYKRALIDLYRTIAS